jgi:hypothetical protein
MTTAASGGGFDQVVEQNVLPITDKIASWVFFSLNIGGVEVPLRCSARSISGLSISAASCSAFD